jgi:hypothetical protein
MTPDQNRQHREQNLPEEAYAVALASLCGARNYAAWWSWPRGYGCSELRDALTDST